MKKLASFVLVSMFMLVTFLGASACNGHNDDNNNNNNNCFGNWWGWGWNNGNGF